VFNVLYFPSDDPFISLLLAYTVFAVGFIARPLGGLIFGHYGDKIGRKTMLIITLMIMGTATVLIGLLPTYAQIGIWAPIILLFLRVCQGIGLGGEWGGAVLMIYEYAPKESRGFYGSLPQLGLSIGLVLASGMLGLLSTILDSQQFLKYGWRIAFILSIVLVAVGLWIRLHILETPEFQKVKDAKKVVKIPIKEVLGKYLGNTIAGMGARYIDGVAFNIYSVWIIGYLTSTVHISRSHAFNAVMAAALIMCFCIPLFGHLSDRFGRTKVYFWGSLFTGLATFPALWLIATSAGNLSIIWLSIIIPFGIFYASVYGPEAPLFCELFPVRVRYSGISFVYQFSGIFASGLTPIIAAWIYKVSGGNVMMVAAYVAFSGLVSAFSAYWIRKRIKVIEDVEVTSTEEKASNASAAGSY